MTRNLLVLPFIVLMIAVGLSGCNRLSPQTLAENDSGDTQPLGDEDSDQPQANVKSGAGQDATTSSLPADNSSQKPTLPINNDVGITAPSVDETDDTSAENAVPPELSERSFVTLEAIESDEPAELFNFLTNVDAAIRELVVLGSNNQVKQAVFREQGLRLGQMKLDAGVQLANSEKSSPDERKTGVLTQLVALSHMSGLGDVKAAQQLEKLAESLVELDDSELAHEGRIVLLGFDLQALQNGIEDNPNQLLTHIEGLFQNPEDRNFPEFMALQQSYSVLNRMGFKPAADRVKEVLVTEYRDVRDPQLRSEAWLFAVDDTQAWANFNQARQQLFKTPGSSAQDMLAAARGLFEAFPSAQTVEQLAKSVANMEYAGFVAASSQLAAYLSQQNQELPDSVSKSVAEQLLADHTARTSLLGQSLAIEGLIDFDGNEIDWSSYDGKVVLIDFWATWCMPCLREMPNLRKVSEQFPEDEFAVLAVNMDDDLDSAAKFIRNQQFPWSNYHFASQAGFASDFAKQYGLNMIPFILLRDQQGQVSAIHVRGEQIEAQIEAALRQESLIPGE